MTFIHLRPLAVSVLASATLLAGAGFAQDETVPETPAMEITGHFLGAEDAPVTVTEYASYTCPHCASFHADVFPQLEENYIDTGKVRFEYREVYFDRPGLWASMMARCGTPEQFFGLSKILFEEQRDWAGEAEAEATVGKLKAIAAEAGIGGDAVDMCLQDGDKAVALVEWYQEGATADNVTGTPNVVVNGENIGSTTYEELSAAIDAALGE